MNIYFYKHDLLNYQCRSKNFKSYLDVGCNYMMSIDLPFSLKTHHQVYLSNFVLAKNMTLRSAVEDN